MSNLPPGVKPSDIPGNRPEDHVYEKALEKVIEGMKKMFLIGADKEMILEDIRGQIDHAKELADEQLQEELAQETKQDIKNGLIPPNCVPETFIMDNKEWLQENKDDIDEKYHDLIDDWTDYINESTDNYMDSVEK